MSDSKDAQEEEPIDVEFTSAEPAEAKPASGGGGPGWIGLMSVGVVAALAGGAIGVVAGGTGGRYAQASEVAVDISKLEETDRDIRESIAQVQQSLRGAEIRLQSLQASNDEQISSTEGLLADLNADVETLKTRYRSLIGAAAVEGDAPDGGDGENGSPAESDGSETDAGALPEPAFTLAGLMDRLESIESVDAGTGGASTQGLTRSVAALQERTSQLEAVDIELREAMAARTALIERLEDDVETLEASLNTVSNKVETHSDQLDAGEVASQEMLEDVTSEVEALRRVVNERLSTLEGAKLTQDEQALVRRADRVLALSTLETALLTGQAFDRELEALALQLPANGRVSALRRFAEEGAPTAEQLAAQLQRLRGRVETAGMPEKPTGQWAWVGDLLGSVVTVREEGTAEGKTASRRVDTALSLLEAGDVAGAIAELSPIEGQQAEILSDWMERAERRVKADSLLERLRSDIVNLEDVE